MKKYISKVSELVKHNTGAFLWILFICGGLSTLSSFISDAITLKMLGCNYSNGFFDPNYLESLQTNSSQSGSSFLLLIIVVLLIITIFSAFIEGGFLSYLKRGKQEEGYIKFFFKSALGKWGRMIGAGLIQILMIFVLMIGGMIVISIPIVIIGPLGDATGFVGYHAMTLVILFTLTVAFILISTIVFTFFITFEAALTGRTVGEWVSNSFAKTKKVFWSMFLWNFVLFVVMFLVSSLAQYNALIRYSSYFLFIVFAWYLMAFVFYPLYNLATERWLVARVEKNKMDEMDKKILESHYKKLMSEENENPNQADFPNN